MLRLVNSSLRVSCPVLSAFCFTLPPSCLWCPAILWLALQVKRTSWGDRLIALRDVWTTLGLFIFVIGGIYVGAFTPTEAAGMGAAGAIAIAYFRGALSWKVLMEVARETTLTTAKLFLVVFGAMIFSNFVNRAGLPEALLNIAQGFDFPPMGVIFMILLIYLVLGCVFESLSMILLSRADLCATGRRPWL